MIIGPPGKPRKLSRKQLRKVIHMTTARCSCGFTELADESLTDHLQRAFMPEDCRGNDGQVHDETAVFTCRCGYVATAAQGLDDHFLEAFTPAGAIGRDGDKHEAAQPPERHVSQLSLDLP
jgi:hypothetical protein